MDELTSFEEQLNRHGVLAFTNKGVSMMPLLRQNRDVMVIRKRGAERLKKYDAVLYRRDNGQYVLHRILKVREHDYLIVGDNCYQKEYVDDDHILGVLTEVIRDGKTVRVTDRGYQAYVHLWCAPFPVRAVLLRGREQYRRLRHLAGRVLRKAGLRKER